MYCVLHIKNVKVEGKKNNKNNTGRGGRQDTGSCRLTSHRGLQGNRALARSVCLFCTDFGFFLKKTATNRTKKDNSYEEEAGEPEYVVDPRVKSAAPKKASPLPCSPIPGELLDRKGRPWLARAMINDLPNGPFMHYVRQRPNGHFDNRFALFF
jgi:hypothetical protein